MSWRGIVLGVMRVPHEPEPPPGSAPKIFRAARNYLTLRTVQWVFLQVVLLAFPALVTLLVFVLGQKNDTPRAVVVVLEVLQVIAWAVYMTQLAVGWAVLRLEFELRWYMLSDRAIRIREGVMSVREKTMALANVQNIDIRQGPLQRLLGIADVEVKTAGGGAGGGGAHGKGEKMGEPMHVAFFRGVDNAEEIRDLVRAGVRRQKDAGLGDLDDHHDSAPQPSVAATEAVREILREAKALRASIEAAQ